MIICGAVVVVAGAVLVAIWRGDDDAKALPKASCGVATTHRLDGDTTILAADPGALTCFETAARACRSASIQVGETGVDAGTAYVFTIDSGGAPCHGTEQSQDRSANFGGSTGRVHSVSCSRIAVTSRGVTLSCGGRDVLIPATVHAHAHAAIRSSAARGQAPTSTIALSAFVERCRTPQGTAPF